MPPALFPIPHEALRDILPVDLKDPSSETRPVSTRLLCRSLRFEHLLSNAPYRDFEPHKKSVLPLNRDIEQISEPFCLPGSEVPPPLKDCRS